MNKATYIFQILLVASLYFISGWLGINYASIGAGSLTLIWLPSGIALSACFLFGKRIWPALIIGSFCSNVPFLYSIDANLVKALLLGGVVSSLDALIGGLFAYHLFQKYVSPKGLFSKEGMRHFVTKVCLLPSLLLMALGLAPTWYLGGYVSFQSDSIAADYLLTVLSGTLSDYHGYFVISPLVVAALEWNRRNHQASENYFTDLLGVLTYMLVSFMIISGFQFAVFLYIPLGVYITTRHHALGATIFVLVTSLFMALITATNFGPFALQTKWHSFVGLLLFVFSLGTPLLLLAISRIEDLSNQHYLQQLVKERTNELNKLVIGLKVNETRLNEANLLIEQENNKKSQFLARASHDIRQPLQVLNMYLASIKTSSSNENNANTKILVDVEHSISDLSGLFNDLLNINRIRKAEIQPREEVVDLRALLYQVQKNFSIEDERREIRVFFPKQDIYVNSDEYLLLRIINNLTSNALKYGRNKAILLAVRLQKEGVSIEVWDQGKGIPQSEKENIFSEFHRLSEQSFMAETDHHYGLGLTIVKGFADLLNYKIELNSQIEKGSCFKIRIPLKNIVTKVVSKEKVLEEDYSIAGATIALIDNDISVLTSTKHYFEQQGCTLFAATQTEDLYALIEEKRVDFIIADYHLDDTQTGRDVIMNIRNIVAEEVPAMIITGDSTVSTTDDIEVFLKPIQPQKLLKHIYQKIMKV